MGLCKTRLSSVLAVLRQHLVELLGGRASLIRSTVIGRIRLVVCQDQMIVLRLLNRLSGSRECVCLILIRLV